MPGIIPDIENTSGNQTKSPHPCSTQLLIVEVERTPSKA